MDFNYTICQNGFLFSLYFCIAHSLIALFFLISTKFSSTFVQTSTCILGNDIEGLLHWWIENVKVFLPSSSATFKAQISCIQEYFCNSPTHRHNHVCCRSQQSFQSHCALCSIHVSRWLRSPRPQIMLCPSIKFISLQPPTYPRKSFINYSLEMAMEWGIGVDWWFHKC